MEETVILTASNNNNSLLRVPTQSGAGSTLSLAGPSVPDSPRQAPPRLPAELVSWVLFSWHLRASYHTRLLEKPLLISPASGYPCLFWGNQLCTQALCGSLIPTRDPGQGTSSGSHSPEQGQGAGKPGKARNREGSWADTAGPWTGLSGQVDGRSGGQRRGGMGWGRIPGRGEPRRRA